MTLAAMKMVKAPEGGWKDHTYYEVRVAFSSSNPIHSAIFYSGFVTGVGGNQDGTPGNYHALWNPHYERVYRLNEVYFLEVVRDLVVADS